MTSLVCAYCKSPEPLTREDLWPRALHRRLVAANASTKPAFWSLRSQRATPSEPKIRDVCGKCNNVILSELDSYMCCLFDSTLVHIPERDELVEFAFDYHLLKRWLLKLCFNSARFHKSGDLFALEAMLPYILGKDDSFGKSVQLFLQLVYPEEVPAEDITPDAPSERPLIFKPTIHRVGHVFFRVSGVGEKLLRAVHLRSFTFVLAFFKPNERRAVQDDFAKVLTSHTGAVLLRPSQPRIKVACNGIGAWASTEGSRANRLVFQNDA